MVMTEFIINVALLNEFIYKIYFKLLIDSQLFTFDWINLQLNKYVTYVFVNTNIDQLIWINNLQCLYSIILNCF